MSRIHAPHVEERFGADALDTFLCAAVYLGTFENRQMNASKLADYVGVPRSTMDLEELERVGRVERSGATGSNLCPYHFKLVAPTPGAPRPRIVQPLRSGPTNWDRAIRTHEPACECDSCS